MRYEIIDNFLDKDIFINLKNVLESNKIPWYYTDEVVRNDKKYNTFYFTHMLFVNNNIDSNLFELMQPILEKLDCKALIRIKANLYTNMGSYIEDPKHTDYPYSHKGALFYINTNDAPTILDDGTKIEAIENRLLKFDPSLIHNSSHPTDKDRRITINFNYM